MITLTPPSQEIIEIVDVGRAPVLVGKITSEMRWSCSQCGEAGAIELTEGHDLEFSHLCPVT